MNKKWVSLKVRWNIFLISILVFSFFNIFSCSAGIITESDLQEMQKQKIESEILKLREETKSITINPWLQSGTLLVALLVAGISLWNAQKTQKNQLYILDEQNKQIEMNRKQLEKTRISNLLKELGSDHVVVKLAALQALSDYENMLPIIVNIIKVEKEPRIISTAVAVLLVLAKASLPLLIEACNLVKRQKLELAKELLVVGIFNKDRIAELLLLDREEIERLRGTQSFNRYFQRINTKYRIFEEVENVPFEEIRKRQQVEILKSYISLESTYGNLLSALSQIIEKLSQDGEKYNLNGGYLRGIYLEGVNLSGWEFKATDLTEANFINVICKECDFSEAKLTRAIFRDSKLRGACFEKATIDEADFKLVPLKGAIFDKCQGKGVKFQGAKFEGASFEETKIVNSHFQGAKGEKVVFTNSILYGSDFNTAILKGADFSYADLSGVRLNSVTAMGANYTGATLRGVHVVSADFADATFERVTVSSIKNFKSANFRGTDWNGAVFQKESTDFKKHILDQLEIDLSQGHDHAESAATKDDKN